MSSLPFDPPLKSEKALMMCLFEGYPRNLRIVRIFLPSDNCVSVDGISYNSAIAVVVPQTCMCIFLPSRVQQIKYARRFKIEITTISAVYWKMPPAAVTRYVTSRRNDCLLSKQESDTSEKKNVILSRKSILKGRKKEVNFHAGPPGAGGKHL